VASPPAGRGRVGAHSDLQVGVIVQQVKVGARLHTAPRLLPHRWALAVPHLHPINFLITRPTHAEGVPPAIPRTSRELATQTTCFSVFNLITSFISYGERKNGSFSCLFNLYNSIAYMRVGHLWNSDEQYTYMQHCRFVLGPPNLGLSRQFMHSPQSSSWLQPLQIPHLRERSPKGPRLFCLAKPAPDFLTVVTFWSGSPGLSGPERD
jgi:hypothetical protein